MLYWNTVTPILKNSLLLFMKSQAFIEFRLVGGTALSLYKGHRVSVDIDLFTDAEYGSVDFDAIDRYLQKQFPYVDSSFGLLPGMGRSYLVGSDRENNIKLDVFYSTDKFIDLPHEEDGIRLASADDIVAMKMDVISRGGRKKDFWDLHELLNDYSLREMLTLHKKRSEFTHDEAQMRRNLVDFTKADEEYDPICLQGKYWEFIKEDFEELIEKE
ncbi:MAG TPA: nucleotidyl transferase AbiEii/AbiGii toxin family protein [Puia sp.]|nr:nucleotidyl transferase AbiEii/AbiGii toxin family protein [Puia sp.]